MAATPAADTVSHTAVDVPAAALEEPEACTTAPLSGLVCQPASSTAPAPLLHEDKAQVHFAGLQQEGAPAPQEGGRRTLGSAGKPDTQPQTRSAMHRAWARALHAFRGYGKNVRQHPVLMLLPPLLLFALCVSLGVYGVMAGAHKEQTDRRTVVTGSATDWAASFKLSLEKSFAPLTTLAILVKQDPNYPHFAQNFPSVAHDLRQMVGTNAISELQVSPMGIISAIYPPDALDIQNRLYADIFAQPALRGGALATIQERQLVLNGPLYFINGGIFGAIARVPIFIQNSTANETFGTNKTLPTNCTDLCWNPVTGEKFWGFVTAILPLGDLRAGNDSRLDILKQKGYNWMMTRPYTSTEANPTNAPAYVFANSSTLPTDPVSVHVEVSNAVWTLYLEPQEGWVPAWRNGMLLLVVLGSCVLALLVAIIFGSWAEQRSLLAEVLASNAALASTTKHLEEEKLRLDALLVRQYNLISVLGNGGGGWGRKKDRAAVVAGDSPHSGESLLVGSVVGSKEGLTLDRIESMRRQLAVSTLSSAADIDSIQTLELLGEGTFGKVYKGLWRGTVVAVKTMVLPANMSGAEKREKMAVMEAAISSSLSHPNIVQTYTYAIRPVKDQGGSPGMPGPELLIAGSVRSTQLGIKSHAHTRGDTTGASMGSAAGSVHSYEVRLVLEFCDRGCLRDALDSGCFNTEEGRINYSAVLDLAADTAKAMLHLHSLNVLHADLKARNIMLKSDGAGVIAKVADFGLSLKMDHMETHMSNVYQGTMTHMAPEILMEGHVSKGADVYAFGITMWELFTAGHPFKGVPRALLGHQVAREALRPLFPATTPPLYRQLAERCWHPMVDMRPTFAEVLDELLQLRAAEAGPCVPLHFQPAPRATLSADGSPLPARAGMSQHAPGHSLTLPMDSTYCGDSDWGKTTVRQRPLTLPKIQEGCLEDHMSEDEVEEQQNRPGAGPHACSPAGPHPCSPPESSPPAPPHAWAGAERSSARSSCGNRRTSRSSCSSRPSPCAAGAGAHTFTAPNAYAHLHSGAAMGAHPMTHAALLGSAAGPITPTPGSPHALPLHLHLPLHLQHVVEEPGTPGTSGTDVPSGVEVMDASMADSSLWKSH